MKVTLSVVKDDTKLLLQRLIAVRNAQQILTETGQGWLSLVHRGFATGTDPYGVPWKPLAAGGGKPLLRSGALRESFMLHQTPASVTIGTDSRIAMFHQHGTPPYTILPREKQALWWPELLHPVSKVNHPGLPRRMMLPESTHGLPQAYSKIVRDAFMRLIGEKK